jgi:putative SOS response-associated peptidase YedK
MCGRFTLRLTPRELQEFFDLFRVPEFSPRYNIAPTQRSPAIRIDAEGHRVADLLQWGLVPPWAQTPAVGSQMINCRSESAATRRAFRCAFRERRCLVPATGFYEWQAAGRSKQPWHLTLKSGEPFAFAGLWESWTGPDQRPLETFTILTTAANAFMAEVHSRMPVLLPRETWPVWLDADVRDAAALEPLLVPSPSEWWERTPVSAFVNNVRNDGPECIRAVRPQRGLFDE